MHPQVESYSDKEKRAYYVQTSQQYINIKLKKKSSWTPPKELRNLSNIFLFLLRILALIVNCLINGEELTIIISIIIIWMTNDDDYEVKWPNFPSCWGNDDRWRRFECELMTFRQEFYRKNVYWIF